MLKLLCSCLSDGWGREGHFWRRKSFCAGKGAEAMLQHGQDQELRVESLTIGKYIEDGWTERGRHPFSSSQRPLQTPTGSFHLRGVSIASSSSFFLIIKHIIGLYIYSASIVFLFSAFCVHFLTTFFAYFVSLFVCLWSYIRRNICCILLSPTRNDPYIRNYTLYRKPYMQIHAFQTRNPIVILLHQSFSSFDMVTWYFNDELALEYTLSSKLCWVKRSYFTWCSQ